MASDYSRTCASPDSLQTGEAPMVSETCEVYVWGSNSSHQLVEGTQEKILQPKMAPSFADAQTVRDHRSPKVCVCHFLSFLKPVVLKALLGGPPDISQFCFGPELAHLIHLIKDLMIS